MTNDTRPQLIAFDMAGTTVDEHDIVYTTLREVTRDAGATYDDETFARWTGTEKRAAITALLDTDDQDRISEVHGTFTRELARRYDERPPVPCEGIEEAFVRLRELGVKIGLTTGFDRPTTDQLLGALGWTEAHVDEVVCATEVAEGRPAPDMIQELMARLDVLDPQRVWAVGDTAADLGAAANAGAVGIGVLTGAGTRELLEANPHAHVLDRAADVVALVERAGDAG